MMSMEKNVPEIRFEGFNKPWSEEKIQELIDRQAITSHLDGNHGELYPRANEFSNSGIPYISANDFVTGFMSFTGCKYLPPQRALQFKKGIAKDGDILFAHNATVGPVAKLTTSYDFVILSTTATYFRCDNKTLINDYLQYALSSKKFVDQYSRVMAQSTRNQVPITVQRKFSVSIPESSSEQTAIGNTFQKLDNLINQHQQKHVKLSNIKKSMLEKMFPKQGETTPEIRFKGFSGEWEERSWRDTVDISTNMLNPRCSQYGELFHVGPGNIESFTGIFYNNVLKVKDSNLISGKFHFNKGDIIYGKINPQLAKYVIAPFEGLASADAYVLNTKNGVVQNYLYAILQTQDFYKYTVSVSSRTGMPKINRDELNIYSYLSPDESEQEKIGSYFQKLDALINQHQQQITKLNNIKQACLSKMFV